MNRCCELDLVEFFFKFPSFLSVSWQQQTRKETIAVEAAVYHRVGQWPHTELERISAVYLLLDLGRNFSQEMVYVLYGNGHNANHPLKHPRSCTVWSYFLQTVGLTHVFRFQTFLLYLNILFTRRLLVGGSNNYFELHWLFYWGFKCCQSRRY